MLHDTDVSVSRFTANLVRTILVVDDEEPIRIFLTELLQDSGYRVLEAASVSQAQRLLAETPVDLVFSDVNMPGGENGFVLEKWVRRHCPDTSVLLTSGFPQGSADTKGLLEPMLPKPYDCAALLRRIEGIFYARVSADQPADARA
jgi:DNA-binding response OmpR family regulator